MPVTAPRAPRASKVNATKTVRTFLFNKPTANKVRFTEQGDNPIVGELYLTKAAHTAMGGGKTVKLTLEISA